MVPRVRITCLFIWLAAAFVLAANFAYANPASDDTAASDPRGVVRNAPPSPKSLSSLYLSDKDVDLYRKIFAAQKRGDQKSVKRMGTRVSDPSLMAWARLKRDPANPLWLPQGSGAMPRNYHSPAPRDAKANAAVRSLYLSVGQLLKTDSVNQAQRLTQNALSDHTIDKIEYAQLLAQIAAAKLYNNDAAGALRLAHTALENGGVIVPEAAWTAGLASWMTGDYRRAAHYFAWPVRSPYAGPWMRSAASYWTARSLMRTGHYREVSAWLREAARHPRSFYGLIATRALGARFDFNWTVPDFTEAHREVLARNAGAVRALKLAQVNQMDMARLELAMLDEKEAKSWREALAALAVAALKPDAAIQVAGLLEHPAGGTVDMALYPVAPWQPKDGYRLDPALINAFIRQESSFKPAAANKVSGATGLLQLMPRTAKSIDKRASKALKNPETSMMLGQKYLEDMLNRTDGNLFEAAIAYNAGPGNLANWKERFATVDDPLLFIELIPYSETRGYVERVMANYWIYSLRMGVGVASLDAVAGGQPALYAYANNRDSKDVLVGTVQDTNVSSR